MSTVTRNGITRMMQALYSLHNETGQILNECGHAPSPGSQAAVELGSFQRPESVRAAYAQANLLIEGAADHLVAFIKTVTEPVETIAPWTCVRAAIECGALASWLLDPGLDARNRIQRSFAFRYEGLRQQVKFARVSGRQSDVDRANDRIYEVERTALRLGFPQVLDRRGRRIGIAQQMPSVTEVVSTTLHEEATYRLLSAMTHAHIWALQQLGFRRVEDEDICLVEKNLEPISVAFLCIKAAQAFAKPIWLKCQLFGWDIERLRTLLDSTFASLGGQWSGS